VHRPLRPPAAPPLPSEPCHATGRPVCSSVASNAQQLTVYASSTRPDIFLRLGASWPLRYAKKPPLFASQVSQPRTTARCVRCVLAHWCNGDHERELYDLI
jgi:hypothetical protein